MPGGPISEPVLVQRFDCGSCTRTRMPEANPTVGCERNTGFFILGRKPFNFLPKNSAAGDGALERGVFLHSSIRYAYSRAELLFSSKYFAFLTPDSAKPLD